MTGECLRNHAPYGVHGKQKHTPEDVLQQVEKFLYGKFCLFDDVHEKRFLDIFSRVNGDNGLAFLCWMSHDNMTASLMILYKSSSFQSSNYLAGTEGW